MQGAYSDTHLGVDLKIGVNDLKMQGTHSRNVAVAKRGVNDLKVQGAHS